jgi:hypothetical protein
MKSHWTPAGRNLLIAVLCIGVPAVAMSAHVEFSTPLELPALPLEPRRHHVAAQQPRSAKPSI